MKNQYVYFGDILVGKMSREIFIVVGIDDEFQLCKLSDGYRFFPIATNVYEKLA